MMKDATLPLARRLRFAEGATTVGILNVAERCGARLKRVASTEWAGPCPVCGGRDRFSVNVTKQIWNCRRCGKGGDHIDMVRHMLGVSFTEAVAFCGDGIVRFNKKENHQRVQPDPDNIACALDIWHQSADPHGTPVEPYLASRALSLGHGLAGGVLRWSPSARAMIALFRNILTGEPQAVSRTFLDPAGRKFERRFLGPVGGAAIMLDGFDAVTSGLHIGEGIETCMAARQLGLCPTWALGSAGAIADFPPLPGITCLTLLAENDDASARAVQACAVRWDKAGCEVLINRPFKAKDLNDVIQGRTA